MFDGLWEYCQIAAGGSLAGAARLNSGENSTVINWAGGLHHAKRAEASGFCYINDCVLAILELLKVHARVLYVDIDIHHGDGVEEAFYTTDRVMTVSFHKYGDYFPGTGDVSDRGTSRGKNYSVNFPLKDGIDDESYRYIFMPVMQKVMEWYQPGAVVLQCGADSLSGDRLGCFNLSLRGHAQCVDFFGQYDVPLLMLGGGGYTIRNVARCWAYETSRVLNADITDELPFNDNYEFYGPEFRLHIATSNMENHNTRSALDKTKVRILEQLRQLPHAPSAPFMDVPRTSPLGVHIRDDDSDDSDPDVRRKSRRARNIPEYDDSDDDDDDDDQYLTSLRVARRKVRKSSFPRRGAPRMQRTSATASSVHSSPTATTAVATTDSYRATNGVVARSSVLVAPYGPTATSDERVERAAPLANDDNVDSSRDASRAAAKRKDAHRERSPTPSVPKRARPLVEEAVTRWNATVQNTAPDVESMDVVKPEDGKAAVASSPKREERPSTPPPSAKENGETSRVLQEPPPSPPPEDAATVPAAGATTTPFMEKMVAVRRESKEESTPAVATTKKKEKEKCGGDEEKKENGVS